MARREMDPRAIAGHLGAGLTWLDRAIRRYPKLAAGVDAVGAVWTKLVAAFCDVIDPYLSRYFPDLRLVAVVTATGAVELHKIAKGGATAMGSVDAIDATATAEITKTTWTSVELRMRPDQVLHRSLSLPGASRDFLGPIIEHRLERMTPWRADSVLYDYRQAAEPEAAGTLAVALTATSKDIVASPLKSLGAIGLVATAIGVDEGPLTEPLRINLFRGGAPAARADSRRLVSHVALGTFAALGILVVATSLWASSAASDQDEASARLLKARRLLKAASVGLLGSREQALLAAKQPDKAMVVLIDKLAVAIPADTYLKELTVTPDKVRLVGSSQNAPALVGKLEASGLVNVRFTAAVTREKDQRDSFEITADRRAAPVAETP